MLTIHGICQCLARKADACLGPEFGGFRHKVTAAVTRQMRLMILRNFGMHSPITWEVLRNDTVTYRWLSSVLSSFIRWPITCTNCQVRCWLSRSELAGPTEWECLLADLQQNLQGNATHPGWVSRAGHPEGHSSFLTCSNGCPASLNTTSIMSMGSVLL